MTNHADSTLSPPHGANPQDLIITRVLNAPRHALWRAWSSPDALQAWWSPTPWRTDIVGFDMKPGGIFHTRRRGPDDTVVDNPGCFLDIVPHSRIVFTSLLTAGWRPAAAWLRYTAIISLSDYQLGTCYTVQVLHADEVTREEHEKAGFFEGWNSVITQLDEVACTLR